MIATQRMQALTLGTFGLAVAGMASAESFVQFLIWLVLIYVNAYNMTTWWGPRR